MNHKGRAHRFRFFMVSLGLVALCVAANAAAPASNDRGAGSVRPTAQRILRNNDIKLPLSFELNAGQADARVRFLSRGRGYSLFLTGSDAVLTLRSGGTSTATSELGKLPPSPLSRSQSEQTSLRLAILGANSKARVVGLEELPGIANYYIGNDPSKWRVNVPTYAKVKYENVYPGVDLVYYGNQQQLEYDFVVAPGADPKTIGLALRNISAATARPRLRLDGSGDLVGYVNGSELRFHKPVVYQSAANGERMPVEGRYSIRGKSQISFEVGSYDRSKPLVIDPVMTYSTFLGGGVTDDATGIALDSSGNMYIVGITNSTDFPTVNAFQGANAGPGDDVFVAKLKADGSALLYSTYLGGSDAFERAGGIAVDASGNAYVAGATFSTNFPLVNPLQSCCGGGDAFIAKIGADGSLAFSTYLGGSLTEFGVSIALDSQGYIYVAGTTLSADFPGVTANVVQPLHGGAGFEIYNPNADVFVAKIKPDLSGLAYATYLGGSNFYNSGSDSLSGLAVDSTGNAYVVGHTRSTDFPVTASAFQATNQGANGGNNGFVSKISPDGSALLYSTYLGGSNVDVAYCVAVDDAGHAYVAGTTTSTDFPTVNALKSTHGDFEDGFVAGFDTTQAGASSLLFSTYFGGSSTDTPVGAALDGAGHLYVVGSTSSGDFPTTANALQGSCADLGCGFLSKLTTDGQTLLYSSYLGGSGIGTGINGVAAKTRNVWVTGLTYSTDFPITANALQSTLKPGTSKFTTVDAFVSSFSFRPFLPPIISPLPVFLASDGTVAFTVGPVDDLLGPLVFDVVGQPSGMTVSPTHFELTPPPNDTASQSIAVTLGPSLTPATYTFSIVEQATHTSTPVTVNVTASTASTAQVIATLLSAGCIDSAGTANALTNKLYAAQSQASSGQVQDAVNTYSALINQLQAQNGKHIASACTLGGIGFSPATVLIGDVRGLSAALKTSGTPNPILGYVVNSANSGLAGATLTLFDSANVPVAAATTDATGFYFFANTGALSPGSEYTVRVTGFPSPLSVSTPASQSFKWAGTGIALGSFALN